MRYIEVIIDTTDIFSDIIAEMLIEEGSEGAVVESLAAVREQVVNHLDYDCADVASKKAISPSESPHYYDESLVDGLPDVVKVKGYFPDLEVLNGIKKRLAALENSAVFDCGSLKLTSAIVDDAEWKDVWKKYYSPMDFGAIVVVPEWIDYKTDKLKLLINPGGAFGTGKHETTGMCLKALSGLNINGKTVADIGCGSGILGIAAILLGAGGAYMTDIDHAAAEQTAANAALNNVSDRIDVDCCDLMSGKRGTYDIIIANIVSDVLIRMSSDIKEFCKTDTKIILSGIINERADEVSGVYAGVGFKELYRTTEGEWTMLLLSAER